ncbi:nucleotide exchange factor GrpE [bacterium]|nr:nucleotide exchange factor GrpE [bacterium]MCI0602845.1 nucleotide exchange factor GrpE [bacterium]
MADEKDDFEDTDFISKGNGKDEDDEDIQIELLDPDNPGSHALEMAPANPVRELEQQMESLRREKDEIYDRLLRKHADFENFRKRSEKDKREFQQYALSDIVGDLIFILDNFERALSHSDDSSNPEYRKGVELIYRQLRDLLEKRGLRIIESKGQKFDPNFHEAVAREPRSDVEEGTILEELQRGYFFQNRLLRPAMVKVSYAPEDESPKENPTESKSDDEWLNKES